MFVTGDKMHVAQALCASFATASFAMTFKMAVSAAPTARTRKAIACKIARRKALSVKKRPRSMDCPIRQNISGVKAVPKKRSKRRA